MNDYYSEGSDGTVFSFNLVLDQSYHSIERKAFTLGDMFGMIGGMDSMLWIIAIIFVRIFSSKMFMLSLISNFYSIKSVKEIVDVNKDDESSEEVKEFAEDINNNFLPIINHSLSINDSGKKIKFEESSFTKINVTPTQNKPKKDDNI